MLTEKNWPACTIAMGSRLNHAVELAELGQLPLLKPNSHLVLLSLGPANTRSTRQVIEGFGQNVETTRCSTWHIRFGGLNTTGDSQVVQLPLSENSVNEPLLLLFDDLAKVQFRFELFVKNKCSKDNSAGVGVALLSTLREGRSQGRESLLRDCTIPLVDNESGSVVASLTFNYFVVHAYNGQRSTQCKDVVHGFWKEGGPTQVVGHRGSGANTTARTNLQLGENTLESLSSAAALGACGVEFDVQLTKDLIPVIYHNFLVMETGGETTIWNLKQDQVRPFDSKSGKLCRWQQQLQPTCFFQHWKHEQSAPTNGIGRTRANKISSSCILASLKVQQDLLLRERRLDTLREMAMER